MPLHVTGVTLERFELCNVSLLSSEILLRKHGTSSGMAQAVRTTAHSEKVSRRTDVPHRSTLKPIVDFEVLGPGTGGRTAAIVGRGVT
jgi:hypothetical protein